jgi:ABC-2 type transport system ATP-binding protein
VLVCGHDVASDTRGSNRLLGYVPDEPHLYDKLSGREFLEFVAEMYGLDRNQAATRIEREIENFELAEFVDTLAESYSHGMKQRMVFAAAMLHDPTVLVVDEPMVGLDPHSVRLVKDLLRARVNAGATIFMSTHTLAMAEELADRIGVIHQGKLLFLGSVGELRAAMAMQNDSLELLYLELIAAQSRPADAVAPPAS